MTVDRFDPLGPLPSGRSVLEASAGTGKTWTIAALACRYVAEAAVPIDQILIVTFTRAATSELRERVRSRLASAARILRSGSDPGGDPVARLLADAGPEERSVRAGRLERALAGFDRATISTLHGFAWRLLTELGMLSGAAGIREVAADHGELVEEAINDLVASRFAAGASDPPRLRDLAQIASGVLTNPDAAILPHPDRVDGPAGVRSRFAADLRSLLDSRSERSGVLTYDELMGRAQAALTSPRTAELARRLLGSRFRIALIDEFQDTDRIQWSIVDALFPSDEKTLVVIGDPKQSIYAFRGADVDAYLDAVEDAPVRRTLGVNWRSDRPLLQGLDALLTGTSFGDARIRYQPVTEAPGRSESRIEGVEAPVHIRGVSRSSPARKTAAGHLTAGGAREFIASDVASYTLDLLEAATIDGEPVGPGDIAVLCRSRREVEMVRAALGACGVPAVVGRTGSVLTSEAAGHWLTLLGALELPSSTSRVRAAAITPFVGWTPSQLVDATDEDLLPLHELILGWEQLLESRGVAALWREMERATGISGRVLAADAGERLATDLDHLTEILHASRRRGARSLAAWLAAEIARAEQESEEAQTRARRLETDADAVQVLSIHGAKGLEFPIVLCPFLWNHYVPTPAVPVFHPPEGRGRAVDVGGSEWDGFPDSQQRAMEEAAGEEARLLYVAVTRARHHLALWWPPCGGAKRSLLSRILFGRDPHTGELRDEVALVTEERLAGHLQPVLDAAAGTVAFRWVTEASATRTWAPPPDEHGDLDGARFDRTIDVAWRRTSFSGIADSADRVPVDPETPAKHDEPEAPAPEEPTILSDELPMAGLPGGARFGTLVHDVLEAVDFTSPVLADDLLAGSATAAARAGLDLDPAVLAAALASVVETPLGPDHAPRLRDIGRADRLSEMVFEMRVTPDHSIGTDDLAAVLRRRLPSGHPLRAYAERLEAMKAARFRGFLTGAIDLVTRLGDPPRYWILDYKTNRLDPPGATPSIRNYSPDRMAAAMLDGDYVLQALIYQVALHRYLGLRLPAYEPARHLGGAMYLFVRGMIGPSTPVMDGGRCGVFAWPADPELIADLDAVLGGRE